MSCCCASKKNDDDDDDDAAAGSQKAGSGRAPLPQSMQDRGDLTDDERAVDWWRSHQELGRDGEDEPNAPPPPPPPNASSQSSQSSQARMEQRNPLAKPYEIFREKPLRPQDGDVLQPSLAAVNASLEPPSSQAASMEVFDPEVMPTLRHSSGKTTGNYDNDIPKDQISAILSPASFSSDHPDPPSTQSDPAARYKHMNSLKLPPKDEQVARMGGQQQKQQQQQQQQKEQQQVRSALTKKSPSKSPTAQEPDGITDHLSDVPSDVDSVTKERYILACQMLKSSLTAKEKKLAPLERKFIMSLLGDYEQSNRLDAASVISEISAVEQATLRLENDPLFQDWEEERPSGKLFPASPLTAAALQRRDDIGKNPHTATRAKLNMKSLLTNPCNPRWLEDAGGATNIALKYRDDEDEEDESSNGMSQYEADTEISDVRSHIIRFDGWNFHESSEYPFEILGAGDPRLQTRVLTPSIMEALRGFVPYSVSESNFWLKFSLVRDGASLTTLLATVRASTYTIIAVETNEGEVFGSFTGAPWRTSTKWFGTGEAFLWRLKKSRLTSSRNAKKSNFENEMEVYPFTGYDDLVQYCTAKTIAVGGGDWINNPCPFQNEPRGIGFMIDGDLAGGESNSCATFANPRLCKKASASNEFSIANLEVWTLTPCLNVNEAAKLEVKKLFVEDHGR